MQAGEQTQEAQQTQQSMLEQQAAAYRPLPQETLVKKSQRSWLKPVATGLLVVTVGVASFFGGMAVGGNDEPKQVAVGGSGQDGQNIPNQPGGSMGGEMPGRMGAMGEVTAVSAFSISIEDLRSGEASTFSINSSTEILDEGETAEVSDIEVGDNVMVVPDDSDEAVAAQIMIEPAIGGPGGRGMTPPGEMSSPDASDSTST